MPRKKYEAKRVSIWLRPKELAVADQIDNLSKFVQMSLLMAPDIMAWALLQEHDPTKYNTHVELKEVVKPYNKKYPLDPLTAKRLNKNVAGTKRKNPYHSQETNPALR